MRVMRIGRYAEGCPNIGNSGWAGDQVTRKRVSQRNTSFGEIISCEVGERTESIIAMSSAKAEIFATCMAAMRMHSTATEQGIVSGVLELHVDANAATGIIGRQGRGKVSHLDLSCL